ncbi:MAG: hypothetical protein AABX51_05720 [Nanoarchaeota archaeon]
MAYRRIASFDGPDEVGKVSVFLGECKDRFNQLLNYTLSLRVQSFGLENQYNSDYFECDISQSCSPKKIIDLVAQEAQYWNAEQTDPDEVMIFLDSLESRLIPAGERQ